MNHARRAIQVLTLAALATTFSTGAFACTPSPNSQSSNQRLALARMQMSFARLKALSKALPHAEEAPADPNGPPPSMVGMWMTTFTLDGQVVDAGFDVWHSDGTQALNDTPPPAAGSVCLGIWTQIDKFTYQLNHPSWTYDDTNTNLTGIVYISETVTLDPGGDRYSGTVTYDAFDLDGNPVFHGEGKVSGERIKIDLPKKE
jgi:hypothetical protein